MSDYRLQAGQEEQRLARDRWGEHRGLRKPAWRRAKSVVTGVERLDLQTIAGTPSGDRQAGRRGGPIAGHTDDTRSSGTGGTKDAAGADS